MFAPLRPIKLRSMAWAEGPPTLTKLIMENKSTFDSGTSGRYADILLDYAFKRSFKEYGNAKRLMLLFLQALIPERKIVGLSYTPEESTNQNLNGKGVRVDVECVDASGQRFVVEVQRAEQLDFYDRAVFNSTFAIQRQLKQGSKRFRFRPVYFVGIMRFSLHPESDRFLYRYALQDTESGDLMTDDLHYIFLEVEKCRGDAGAPLVERLGYSLCHLPSLEGRPAGFEEEIFDLLFSSADLNNFAPEDKIKYENDMTTERDIQNQIDFAREKGFKLGRAEGRAEGMAKGSAEERGRIVELLRRQGVSEDIVAKVLAGPGGSGEE